MGTGAISRSLPALILLAGSVPSLWPISLHAWAYQYSAGYLSGTPRSRVLSLVLCPANQLPWSTWMPCLLSPGRPLGCTLNVPFLCYLKNVQAVLGPSTFVFSKLCSSLPDVQCLENRSLEVSWKHYFYFLDCYKIWCHSDLHVTNFFPSGILGCLSLVFSSFPMLYVGVDAFSI